MKHKYYEDERIIAAFTNNFTAAEISKASGLSVKTVYRYRHDPEFQKIIRERKHRIMETAINKMQGNMMRNFDKLQAIIDNPETSPQVVVNAIQLYATQLRDWTTTEDIMKQLEELQATVKANFDADNGVLK